MPTKPRMQARVRPDIKEALTDYAEQHDLSESDALRQIVTTELQREGHLKPYADGGRNTLTAQLQSSSLSVSLFSAWSGLVLGISLLLDHFVSVFSPQLFTAAAAAFFAVYALVVALLAIGAYHLSPWIARLLTGAADTLRGLLPSRGEEPA